jgi:hypothetical protein
MYMKQWLKDFVHNVIVHPLMMVLPSDKATELHDRNARWCWGDNHYPELKLEQFPVAWLTDRDTLYFDKQDAYDDCDGFIYPLYR